MRFDRLAAVLFATLFAAGLVFAQPKETPKVKDGPPIKAPGVPPKVSAKLGELVQFKVTGKDVGYCATFDPAKCLLLRVHTEEVDTIAFLAQPKEPGNYGIAFWVKGEIAGVVVTVTCDTPIPPKPILPPIVNPYRDQLKTAFDGDAGDAAKKAETRKDMAELYRQAGTLAADTSFTGTKQLREKIKTVAAKLADDQLLDTRAMIADIVGGVLPSDAPLDAATRLKAATLFAAIADALTW